jgi:arginyl-tRNA synthetase
VYPAQLADEIREILARLVASGELAPTTRVPAYVRIERPVRASRGDFASPVALRVTGTGVSPRALADLLAGGLRDRQGIAGAEAVEEGFVNVVLTPASLAEIVRGILAGATVAGSSDSGDHAAVFAPPGDGLTSGLRYAHARLAALLRAGGALGVARDPDRLDPGELTPPPARRLVCALAEYPGVSGRENVRAFHRHLAEVLSCVEDYEGSTSMLPRGDEEATPAHGSRLVLVDAARIVVANALRRCGVSAPDRL